MEQTNDFYDFPPKSKKERGPKEPNTMATVAMLLGLLGVMLSCSCSLFPGAIGSGVAAIATAVLSKKGKPFRGTAILGILFGVIAILAGVVEFAYLVMLTTAMKNPDYAPFFNQVFEQMEQMGYFDKIPESVRP